MGQAMGNLDGRLKRLETHHAACNHWDGQRPTVLLFNPTDDEVARMQKELADCPGCRKRGGPPDILIYDHPDLEGSET